MMVPDRPKDKIPSITANLKKASYSSVWLYHHPMNDGGRHRRLNSFDISCLIDGTWKRVLNQDDAPAKKMFKEIDGRVPPKREEPCWSCWVRVRFPACETTKVKVDRFNSGKKGVRVYVFELVFSGAVADSEMRARLPVPTAPRIQGKL